MSKKPRKSKRTKPSSLPTKTKRRSYRPNRRTFIKLGVAVMLTVPAYFGVSAYIDKHAVLHDLSTIGQGKPVLVQIHDPQCSRCLKLLSSVESVLSEFPSVEFRIANIKTSSGSGFAYRHGVSNVTLLMFDERGKKLDTGVGFQSDEEVREFLDQNIDT